MEENKTINELLVSHGIESVTDFQDVHQRKTQSTSLLRAYTVAASIALSGVFGFAVGYYAQSHPSQQIVEKTKVAKLLPVTEALPNAWENASYIGLYWESTALLNNQGEKEWLRYDISDARLRQNGMRHPYPWESGALICAGLEGKLTGNMKAVYKNMWGEWQNAAHRLDEQAKEIIVYLDPVFSWNNGYTLDGHGQVLRIPAEKAKVGWNNIRDLGDSASAVYFDRHVSNLPSLLKDAQIYLSPEAMPVARGDYVWFFIFDWASRGVRAVAQKNPMP